MGKIQKIHDADDNAAASAKVDAFARSGDSGVILRMIDKLAAKPDVDLMRVEQMFDLYERAQAHEARLQFDASLSDMQPNLPVIEARGRIKNNAGKTQSNYARWEDCVEKINPIVSRYGFALSFNTTNVESNQVTVTCTLSHQSGHRESTSLTLPFDSSGSKNTVQSIGSSLSYGKRYTAFALLNIVSRGEDDDGLSAGSNRISDEQAQAIRDLVESTGSDLNKFLTAFQVDQIQDLPAKAYDRAVSLLSRKSLKAKQGAADANC